MKNEFNLDGTVFRYTGIRNYFISEYGDVISISKKGKIKFLKNSITHDGYARIALKYEKGKEKKYRINRLVYMTFVGQLIDGLVIDHIDGNRLNNHYSNLRQITQKDNIKNAIRLNNFGRNNSSPIGVFDTKTNIGRSYDSIADFFSKNNIKTHNGGLSTLNKYKEHKNRYIISKHKKKSTDYRKLHTYLEIDELKIRCE